LSVKLADGKILLHCFGGCATDQVLAALGLELQDLFPDSEPAIGRRAGAARIVATYPYHDEGGAVLYEQVRLEPKDFRARRPDGAGGWTWNLKGVRRVLFGLPDLIDRTDVYLVEGEKDALALRALGLAATTTAGGAKAWSKGDYARQIRKAGCLRLVILPDNDDAGRQYAADAARDCTAAGIEVKVLELPGLAEHGDVSDWLEAGHDGAELGALIADAPAWTPAGEPAAEEAGVRHQHDHPHPRPEKTPPARQSAPKATLGKRLAINAADQDLPRVTAEAIAALVLANDPPVLFRFGGMVIRLEHDERGAPVLRPMTEDRMRHQLARAALWTTLRASRNGGEPTAVPTLPPMPVVKDVLASPDLPFPILSRVVEVPVFGADGRPHLRRGYLPGSGLFLELPPRFPDIAVPEKPSESDIRAARDLWLEMLEDFPFTSHSELAHALTVGWLPFLRDLIDGPTPLYLIEKPSPGTGATLLAEALLLPTTGRPIGTLTEGRDEDEWRKRLTAKLATSPAAVVIDNLRRPLTASSVAAAITSREWEDRLLGGSALARFVVRCVWLATGNNPALSNEITRRTIRIRLDAGVERPWLRDTFRHPDLRGWVLQHRAELVRAALVLGQGWIAAGRPMGTATMGMFEDWARVMGGVLEVAGVPGFLKNLDSFYQASDNEAAAWRELCERWFDRYQDRPIGVANLWPLVNLSDPLPPIDLPLGDGSERSQRTRFGHLLKSQRGRVLAGFRIEADGTLHGAQLWRLAKVNL